MTRFIDSGNFYTHTHFDKCQFDFRQFDIREPHNCTREENVCLIDLQNHIGGSAEAKCVAVNPRRPEQLAVGASDAYARVYDRRMIKLSRVHSFPVFI